MRTVSLRLGRSFLMLQTSTLMLFFVLALMNSAAAATFPLYVTGTGSGDITITGDAGTTNIRDGNTTMRPCG